MTEDQRNFLLQRYRSMETEELIELRAGNLTEVATEAINNVIEERGISPNQQREITEQVTEERRAASEPYGVRGWLALLAAWMMFLRPLVGAIYIDSDTTMVEFLSPSIRSLPEWTTYKNAIWVAFLVVVAMSFYGGLGLVRGREWSVVTRAKQILWITGPLASIVMGVIIPLSIFGTTVLTGPVVVGTLIAFLLVLILTHMLTAYLSQSKRVRNTYGNRRPQQKR